MNTFKIGDRVRIVKDEMTGFNGREGDVVGAYEGVKEEVIDVFFDDQTWPFVSDEIELIASSTTKENVTVLEGVVSSYYGEGGRRNWREVGSRDPEALLEGIEDGDRVRITIERLEAM